MLAHAVQAANLRGRARCRQQPQERAAAQGHQAAARPPRASARFLYFGDAIQRAGLSQAALFARGAPPPSPARASTRRRARISAGSRLVLRGGGPRPGRTLPSPGATSRACARTRAALLTIARVVVRIAAWAIGRRVRALGGAFLLLRVIVGKVGRRAGPGARPPPPTLYARAARGWRRGGSASAAAPGCLPLVVQVHLG